MSENLSTKIQAVAKTDTIPNSTQIVRIAPCAEEVPALETGGCTYYANRNSNFLERRPTRKPPTYYLNYGFKYCSKFKAETYPELSEEGKVWLDKTLKSLQKLMEKGIVERAFVSVNNDAYNTRYSLENIYDDEGDITSVKEQVKEFYKGIECREEHFKDFAFATHPDAYNPQEMQKLPISDLWHIAWTPDLKEWLDGKTWEQALIMYDKMDVSEIATRPVKEAGESVAESATKAKEALIKIFE